MLLAHVSNWTLAEIGEMTFTGVVTWLEAAHRSGLLTDEM